VLVSVAPPSPCCCTWCSTWPTHIIAAVLTSAIATATAWPLLSNHPTYQVASFHLTAPMLIWSVLLGPLAGVTSAGFTQLTTAARTHTPRGWRLPVATTVLFVAVGTLAIPFPQLLGNGKGPAQLAFNGALGLPLFAALVLLKPLATALCLRSGATGGLLTPALATGALLGAATGGLLDPPVARHTAGRLRPHRCRRRPRHHPTRTTHRDRARPRIHPHRPDPARPHSDRRRSSHPHPPTPALAGRKHAADRLMTT